MEVQHKQVVAESTNRSEQERSDSPSLRAHLKQPPKNPSRARAIASLARRPRSTHLELLGGVSSDALRRIRDTAQKADLPLERVFRDVVAIGVSVVSDPEESPYQSLIAFRAGLATKQAELEHVEQRESAPEFEPTLRGGDSTLDFRESVMAVPPADTAGETGNDQDRSDDALERPGQWIENEAGVETLP